MDAEPPCPDPVAGASQPAGRGVTAAAISGGASTDSGVMRPLPVHSRFPSALPTTPEEIHKVLAALGPGLAAIFDEEA